jgi:hypothetical protein
MFRRTAYEAAGGFDPQLVGEDCDFYTAVAAAGFELRFDPVPLIVKRMTRGNLSNRADLFFEDPFKTLAKYRTRINEDDYRRIENNLQRGMARAAVYSGRLRLGLSLVSQWANRVGSVRPYRFFLADLMHWAVRLPVPMTVRYLIKRRLARFKSRATLVSRSADHEFSSTERHGVT